MQLSVIIVNYNVCYFLEQCLCSVFKATKFIEAEIFVVDNNSVDESIGMVNEKFPTVKLIENKQNRGFSYANNQAIKQSTGEYVLLLNPDTVVEEETFRKVIGFMDEHPIAGGLGVMMIDGKGNFLPESKRGLPTPRVAFYKIFGLASLFPKSRIFGKYHLGYLDNNKLQEIEILSGAFMFLRKSALEKVGLLDEHFFMYGEDIDLSYRLIKGGYKNYYFPDARIIHYKGESTKKSSINYVFVFYRAMVIFARKHFSNQNVKTYSFFINIAIYLRASLAVFMRFFRSVSLPIIDFLLCYFTLLFTSRFWQEYIKHADDGFFPERFYKIILPAYSVIWLISGVLNGAFDKPLKIINSLKSVVLGAIAILVVYALLPETIRYSRGVIVLGTPVIATVLISIRWLLSKTNVSDFVLSNQKNKRFAIVGNYEEASRVLNVLSNTSIKSEQVFFISSSSEFDKKKFAGSTLDLKSVLKANNIDEIIFCAENLSFTQIIEFMATLVNLKVDFKIAPPNSMYIIGSNSLDTAGDLYIIDLNTIIKPENVRNKRIFDFVCSLILLLTSPLIIWLYKNKFRFFRNVISVLFGSKSIVGYAESPNNINLPKISIGILSPADALASNKVDSDTIILLNEHYAKNFQTMNDFKIFKRAFNKLDA